MGYMGWETNGDGRVLGGNGRWDGMGVESDSNGGGESGDVMGM